MKMRKKMMEMQKMTPVSKRWINQKRVTKMNQIKWIQKMKVELVSNECIGKKFFRVSYQIRSHIRFQITFNLFPILFHIILTFHLLYFSISFSALFFLVLFTVY